MSDFQEKTNLEEKVLPKKSTWTFCIIFPLEPQAVAAYNVIIQKIILFAVHTNFCTPFQKDFQSCFYSAAPFIISVWSLVMQKLAATESGSKTKSVFVSEVSHQFGRKFSG